MALTFSEISKMTLISTLKAMQNLDQITSVDDLRRFAGDLECECFVAETEKFNQRIIQEINSVGAVDRYYPAYYKREFDVFWGHANQIRDEILAEAFRLVVQHYVPQHDLRNTVIEIIDVYGKSTKYAFDDLPADHLFEIASRYIEGQSIDIVADKRPILFYSSKSVVQQLRERARAQEKAKANKLEAA
jgi:hypothetical protein